MLATARQGGPFPANEVKAMSAGRLEHYMRADGDRFFVRPDIVNRVTFRAHDLLREQRGDLGHADRLVGRRLSDRAAMVMFVNSEEV